MAKEKKVEGEGCAFKIFLEESLERKRNVMMDSFSQILQWIPTRDASSFSTQSGGATPFKVQVKFEISIFEGQIDTNAVDIWLNLLEGYFLAHDFSNR